MAIKHNKKVQIMDLGTHSIKYGVFKIGKEEEVIPETKDVYKIPQAYSGVDVYIESIGTYLNDIAEKTIINGHFFTLSFFLNGKKKLLLK